MTDLPYTDDDLRAEAASQHQALTEDPDYMGIGEAMDDDIVTSTEPSSSKTWSELLTDDEDFDTARRAIDDLISKAADVSRWAVDLGADGLTDTLDMGWSCTASGRDLAVQIAHRKHIKPGLRDEIESAVRLAVERVLVEHGFKPRLT